MKSDPVLKVLETGSRVVLGLWNAPVEETGYYTQTLTSHCSTGKHRPKYAGDIITGNMPWLLQCWRPTNTNWCLTKRRSILNSMKIKYIDSCECLTVSQTEKTEIDYFTTDHSLLNYKRGQDKSRRGSPAFSAGSAGRISPAPWGARWAGRDAPRWPGHRSSPPGHPAWMWLCWCTRGSAPVCSPPEWDGRATLWACVSEEWASRRQADGRKGEQASVALAQAGRNKASKGGWAESPLGTQGGKFRNWPKYRRGFAAPALPHRHLLPRYEGSARSTD